jgi:hypothetical protein
VRRYVGALISHTHDAEDVVQDFLTRAVGRPFTPEQVQRGRFRDYLKAALCNAAITYYRRTASPHRAAAVRSFPAAEVDDAADRAWLAEWRGCLLQRAWDALEQHEHLTPRGIANTALRLAVDHPEESSESLAARATALTGHAVGAATFRKQLSRARRRFAQLLVNEIRQTLEQGRAEDVIEELCDLGLMDVVRDFLPEPFRRASGQP